MTGMLGFIMRRDKSEESEIRERMLDVRRQWGRAGVKAVGPWHFRLQFREGKVL